MTIGIVGLGYVGLPLAVAFAEAGERVIGVDTSVAKVASIRRGESYIEDIPSEQLAAVRSQLEATTRTSRLALADAIIIAVPTPLTPNREPDLGPLLAAAPVRLRRPPGRPAGRPRVDDLPGHDARAPAADPRGDRPAGRRRLPPGLLARARRSGQRDLRPGQHAEDHRRPHPRLRRQGRGPLRHASASRSSRSPPPRWPRWRSCSRTSSARSTSRSSTSSGCSPSAWTSTSTRSSTPPRPSRSATCASSRARAWAATACPSTRST